jgi:Domain of unknown function (DUF4394)/Calx-beta domain
MEGGSVAILAGRAVTLAIVAAALASPGRALAEPAVATGGNGLAFFDTSQPAEITELPVTGLGLLENIEAIAFRPATRDLYALTTRFSAPRGQLYRVDLSTGVATAIGPRIALTTASEVGIDFSPVSDRIRIVASDEMNFRLHPDTGEVFADTPLNPGDPRIAEAAYTDDFPGATSTTLYGMDVNNGLVRIGGPGGDPSPNFGLVTPLPSPDLDTGGSSLGFDISPGGTPYLKAGFVAPQALYALDPVSFTPTALGTIGSPSRVWQDIAIRPTPTAIALTASALELDEAGGSAMLTIHRSAPFGPASVSFATADGTATAGGDYTATNGTASFALGQADTTVSVPILDDEVAEDDESFQLTLSQPAGPLAELGAPVVAEVKIVPGPTARVSGFDSTNSRFAIGRKATPRSAASKTKVGTRFKFTLADVESAAAELQIKRLLPGRKVSGKCRKVSRTNRGRRHCTRKKTVGTLRRTAGKGSNSISFTGRIGKKALKPGRYKARLTATGSSDKESKAVTTGFRIVKR